MIGLIAGFIVGGIIGYTIHSILEMADEQESKTEIKENEKCKSCRNYHSHNGICDICHSRAPFGCYKAKKAEGEEKNENND